MGAPRAVFVTVTTSTAGDDALRHGAGAPLRPRPPSVGPIQTKRGYDIPGLEASPVPTSPCLPALAPPPAEQVAHMSSTCRRASRSWASHHCTASSPARRSSGAWNGWAAPVLGLPGRGRPPTGHESSTVSVIGCRGPLILTGVTGPLGAPRPCPAQVARRRCLPLGHAVNPRMPALDNPWPDMAQPLRGTAFFTPSPPQDFLYEPSTSSSMPGLVPGIGRSRLARAVRDGGTLPGRGEVAARRRPAYRGRRSHGGDNV